MGLNLGVLDFVNHTRKNKRKTNAFMIFVRRAAFYACLSSRSYMQATYAPDEPWLFWLREEPEDTQIQPHVRIKMVQVLGSLVFICGVNPEVLKNKSTVTFKL